MVIFWNADLWTSAPENSEPIVTIFTLNDMNEATNPTPFMPLRSSTHSSTPIKAINTVSPTATATMQPSATPKESGKQEQTEIPASAYISGVVGQPQWFTLDCEARSAVDWARFFGVTIDERDFLDRMPSSDDPEQGFVGYVNGPMGQLPPDDYGVHPPPVAALLSEFGLNAKAVDSMSYQELQREIASGRPVIVWIINIPFEIEPRQYTAPNGNTSVVAPFEHTWIVTGYNLYTVTVVDSEWTYNVRLRNFLERWEALGNRAIIKD